MFGVFALESPYIEKNKDWSSQGIYCSNGKCIISSDDGNVYSFNPENYQIENLKIYGEDFEGVTISGNNIYLIEERSRKLLKYDNEFQLLKTVTLPYSG